ncbi:MAG: hypothetical protein H6Q74_1131 [Firmicutes bacterium]|nr:hypothetical protein [Bacillota bacterium]
MEMILYYILLYFNYFENNKNYNKYPDEENGVDIPVIEAIDQANTILFFASDESRAVTGQIMVVDNGRLL